MNKDTQQSARIYHKLYISLTAMVLAFSMVLQFPVAKAATTATPTWTKDSSGTTNGLNDITYGNGKWAAVGSGKTILTSSDGIHWNTIQNPKGNGITNNTLRQIAYDGTTWWITDGYQDAFHASSLTPSKWSDTSNIRTTSTPTGLAVSASSAAKAVVVDGTGLYEYNGSSGTWSSVISSGPYAVIYADGKYVVGGSGQIQYSADGGIKWSNIPTVFNHTGDIIYAITYSQGQFVAVGSDQHVTTGVVYTSPDGITWTRQSVSLPVLNSVAGSANGYIAVGDSGLVYSSRHGLAWTKQNSGVTQNLNSVHYANGRYVAVGDNGTIITLSNNANLASLSLSKGALSPSFSAGTTNYTASTADSSVSVTASGYDNASLVVNGSVVTSGSPSSPIALTEGKNTIPIVVTAQDGMAQKTYTLTVNRDSIPPTVNFGTNGDGTYAKSDSTTVTVIDKGVGVAASTLQYAWTESPSTPGSGTTWTSFTNGETLTKSGVSGDWYLHIQARDKLGNTANVATNRFRLDNSAPTVSVQFKKQDNSSYTSGDWTKQNITAVVNASDGLSGVSTIQYKKDGASWQTYTSPLTFFTAGFHTLEVKATDKLGNSVTSKPYSINISVTGLQHSGLTSTGWHESWNGAKGTGAVKYAVYLNGSLVGTTTSPSYDFSNEQPDTMYSVTVEILNGSAKASAQSAADTVHTLTSLSAPANVPRLNVLERTPYQQSIEATGGLAPYTFTIVNGSLPKGVTLKSYGTLSGTPQQSGTYGFTVQIEDGTGATVTKNMSLYVIPTAPTGYFRTVTTSQVVGNGGGTLASTSNDTQATLVIVSGAFAKQLQMNLTTGTVGPSFVPSGWQVVAAYGVNFNSQYTPSKPLSFTLLNQGITPQSKVYKIVNGKFVPVTATVTKGKAAISFTTDPDFVVLKPKPTPQAPKTVPQATKPVTGFPAFPWVTGGLLSILTGGLALWWQNRKKPLR
ncbi:cadherin-like beta sandwich domain-containing protein [Alicyclobacillus sp. SO9]|uniref:OmpL47-type beta-barrel domain-containing protein n=1 Tax=Alicyclobacillus sp. SO9 TaxID=2665646 RepID=UPI0018E80B63|nr:cadherin-like beta sandwich domain-containing protein [Alicyclobacillus sp. SO9]QQE78322.1 cadherin-like beta sandwich domain-containing protein [Alicyclobacillus sp. SO9]